jgi:hypothetical protein
VSEHPLRNDFGRCFKDEEVSCERDNVLKDGFDGLGVRRRGKVATLHSLADRAQDDQKDYDVVKPFPFCEPHGVVTQLALVAEQV